MIATKRQKIEKANYLKLISIIAHNVKGPVKYMQFITDFTLKNWTQMQPDDLMDCARVINESARNISEHLGKILSWARIQDRTLFADKRPFNLNLVVKEELLVQKPFARLKGINISVDILENTALVNDENLFRLAFHNVVTNAIKFTDKAGQIKIYTNQTKDYLEIYVEDNGIGMNQDELSLLQNKRSFSKLGTVNEQGSGFGIQVTKELMQMIDGEVYIDSNSGKGTTVTFRIPA